MSRLFDQADTNDNPTPLSRMGLGQTQALCCVLALWPVLGHFRAIEVPASRPVRRYPGMGPAARLGNDPRVGAVMDQIASSSSIRRAAVVPSRDGPGRLDGWEQLQPGEAISHTTATIEGSTRTADREADRYIRSALERGRMQKRMTKRQLRLSFPALF